jgi:hypothetical protein
LRHGGTGDSWYGHDADLAAQREAFKKKGLDYYQDENGMYKLRPIEEAPTEPVEEKKGSQVNPEGDGDKEKQETPSQVSNGKFNIDPRIFSIAHNAYANAVNNKMTDRQIKALRNSVTLYDPKDTTKYVQGDFDALMQGE